MSGILNVFFVCPEAVSINEQFIGKRIDVAITVEGTCSFHCYMHIIYIPIKASPFGTDSDFKIFAVLPVPNAGFDFSSSKVENCFARIYETEGV